MYMSFLLPTFKVKEETSPKPQQVCISRGGQQEEPEQEPFSLADYSWNQLQLRVVNCVAKLIYAGAILV